jgi:hypothetical protein
VIKLKRKKFVINGGIRGVEWRNLTNILWQVFDKGFMKVDGERRIKVQGKVH